MNTDIDAYVDLVGEERMESLVDLVGRKLTDKLFERLKSLDTADLEIVFSEAKKFHEVPILRDKKLNKLGLHVFRILAAEACFNRRKQRNGSDDGGVDARLVKDGCIVIEDFLDEDTFARVEALVMDPDILEKLPGFDKEGFGWYGRYHLRQANEKSRLGQEAENTLISDVYQCPRLIRIAEVTAGIRPVSYSNMFIEKLRHLEGDVQREIHCDIFFSAIKFWLFLHEVTIDSGPFCYSIGSHVNTPRRLEWEYRQSINAHKSDNEGHRGGSFRVSEKELVEDLECQRPTPLCVKKNSLVLQDNRGFHSRGTGAPGAMRIGLYGDVRSKAFDSGQSDPDANSPGSVE